MKESKAKDLTLDELYHKMLKRAAEGKNVEDIDNADPKMIECLAHPEETSLVWRVKPCTCSEDKQAECVKTCQWDAMHPSPEGVQIDPDKCVGCQACVDACKLEALKTKKDIIPVVEALKKGDTPIYALVAPAFSGQFGPEVTAGKLRTALKLLGFSGMLEVAVFADILTLKEALEFDKNVNKEGDFQLTSCCCPMWIAMIRRQYHQLMPNVPGAVSPMIAGGRTVKVLHPEAKTVFIGPCMAKKAEMKEPDLKGAIDYVLTYEELRDLFSTTNLDLASLEEDNVPHASKAGICYAYAGGVAAAVDATVKKLNPHRKIEMKIRRADSVPECRAMIDNILKGNHEGNFFEGMGCKGGCVGGPKALVNRDEGKKNVQAYSDEAQYKTPAENPYVIELLKKLGFATVEEFLAKSDLYDRKFD
ncbi:[Fe-Fe] hydrogenase large subunit C-terminal domain-containing protein [uncultured Acidaminococcus sp.]|uniref:[Fe-Fe] hydrogenase large subunit C-terminal domain-containing protein n=1 Tax=uncultured Acidaminococcus sp. TaxID=352152 RepID=UPI00262BAFF3|nr:[Fe-Fe] hydrogenase large subunit C-terminal domain-containing protein [uncultured Acidaminococcus sp.]